MSSRGRIALFSFLLCGLGTALASAETAQNIVNGGGFNPNRSYFNQLPFEHIDPMTGNLLLTFTDLTLPGNAGFDLRIQRTYNSKFATRTVVEDSWAGIGWTLHMGRVFFPNATFTNPPVIEMPDGSQHHSYANVKDTSKFITRDFWIFDRSVSPPTLKLPNGVVYTFGQQVGGDVAYVTKIRDAFGNTIDVAYMSGAGLPPDGISTITQRVGSQTRVIKFKAETVHGSLTEMSFGSHTWNYTSSFPSATSSFSLLTRVDPPAGTPWQYQYNTTTDPKYELTGVTTPHGGQITYTFQTKTLELGSTTPIQTRSLVRRLLGGFDIPAGQWDYDYGVGAGRNQSTITAPCGAGGASTVTTYTYLGIGNFTGAEAPWRVGLLAQKDIAEGGTTLESEKQVWIASDLISNDQETISALIQQHGINVPLVSRRTVTRGGVDYATDNTYHQAPAPFNDYGRPHQIVENAAAPAGRLKRTTEIVFKYNFIPYIVDRIESETVTVDGQSFVKSYAYNTANGFKTAETIHGITTSYGMESGTGNVESKTEPDNGSGSHTTHFTYDWGVVKEVQTPLYTISRVINPEGTVASETNGEGFTTEFQYDPAFRPTLTTPPATSPATNATSTTYDNTAGRTIVVERGRSSLTTTLDGFGRKSTTVNAVGVKTDTSYDACGRVGYDSLPYTTANIGTRFAYDGLNRIRKKTNPLNKSVTYAYGNGIDVTVTDEEDRRTLQDYSAFGDPSDSRLMAVTEGLGSEIAATTQYSYNALGSLTQVRHPGGGGLPAGVTRSWAYYGAGQAGGTPGLLKSEENPESGKVDYTYSPAGTLKSRTDALNRVTTYTYDANSRLTFVDQAGSAYDTTIGYDKANNRTLLRNGPVTSAFGWDGANRLRQRKDVVNGKTLLTVYTPDGNDNIAALTYPSGFKVGYTYDAENRVTLVKNDVTNAAFASAWSYHPSGAPLQFTGGDGIVRKFSYDNLYRAETIVQGSSLNLRYSYFDAGNVKQITDARPGMTQDFTYDRLDRLETASGPWGGGRFTYDAVGNRRSASVGGSTSYTYDSTTLRLTAIGGQSIGYDSSGNVTSDAGGANTYAYTPADMLDAASVGGAMTSYRYDGDNQRTMSVEDGKNHYYIHQLGGQLVGEYTDSPCGAGTLATVEYVYAGSRLLAAAEPALPKVSLDLATLSVAENGVKASLVVRLSTADNCPTQAAATVAYSTADGTAASGVDYTAVSGVLTFPENSTSGSSQTIAVPIENDTGIEANETFTLRLSSPGGAALGTASAVVTIVDNDTPVVSFVGAASSLGEDGHVMSGSALPRAVVTTGDGNTLPAAVSVQYATGAGPAPAATAGADYTAQTGTITFAAGTAGGATQAIAVPIAQDALVESDEGFNITLSAPVGAKLGAPTVSTVTIVDDEPSVAWSAAAGSVGEGAGQVQLVVAVTTKPGFPATTPNTVTVRYATANGTPAASGAVAGKDYTASSGTLTFSGPVASGATQTITVPIIQDALVENDERFTVALSAPAGARLGAPSASTVTILDDEPSVAWTATTSSVGEGAGQAQVVVTVTTKPGFPATTPNPVTVRYATANGTPAASGAVAGKDYTTSSGTLTFPGPVASGATQTINVPILEDAFSEADETFTVTLSAPTGARLGSPAVQTVTLLDDEPLPTLSIADACVAEGAANAVFTLSLSHASGRVITVSYATANGTAVAPGDYTARTGVVSMPAGTLTKTLPIPVVADAADEANEVFLVNLSAPAGARLGRSQAQGTILDDDGRAALCTPILTAPFTIGVSGSYCLVGPLATAIADGNAITVAADDVLIDLQGFSLDGVAAGAATRANGIYALKRRNVRVRNGVVRGFHRGVYLDDDPPFGVSTGHEVDNVQAIENRLAGLWVEGADSLIADNQVRRTGGTTAGGADSDAFGIVAFGARARVLRNDASGTSAVGAGTAYGVQVSNAAGAVVSRNRIAGAATGIQLNAAPEAMAEGNRLANLGLGIEYAAGSSGKYRGNLSVSVATPFVGGTDAGGNQ